jgi:hypothetical protein
VRLARLLINEDRHAERSSPSPMPEGAMGEVMGWKVRGLAAGPSSVFGRDSGPTAQARLRIGPATTTGGRAPWWQFPFL